jgi:hypothetical protein
MRNYIPVTCFITNCDIDVTHTPQQRLHDVPDRKPSQFETGDQEKSSADIHRRIASTNRIQAEAARLEKIETQARWPDFRNTADYVFSRIRCMIRSTHVQERPAQLWWRSSRSEPERAGLQRSPLQAFLIRTTGANRCLDTARTEVSTWRGSLSFYMSERSIMSEGRSLH